MNKDKKILQVTVNGGGGDVVMYALLG